MNRAKRAAVCALPALVLWASASAQVRTENILPASTDPAISGWLSAHVAAHSPTLGPGIARRNQLFLYLHGQGGTGGGAVELLRTAAEQGYHAVGLTYPNDWSPFNLCASTGDPACPENLRREIIDGVDRSAQISVSPANSIENRVIKLLARLDALHPGEGWAQFLISGSSIRWDQVAVWGHSQGGGNAGVLARHNVLARVCLSAPAADGGPGNPAPWWAQHLTPSDRYFGFCHTQDALAAKVAFWNALGMGAFGSVVDVAAALPPYSSTHQLSTSVEPAIAGQYHNSVVSDAVTPRVAGPGTAPVYKPAWEYLMTATGGGTPNPNTPTWNDVVFASEPGSAGPVILMMDIYAATAGSGPRPLLVWIHGGGWQGGSHNQVPAAALELRAQGVTVASIGYRLSGEAIFPAQIHDCKGAIRFLRANAATFGIDADRVAAWGSSAGGHLAALVATSGDLSDLEGTSGGNAGFSSRVMAGLSYFGPTDILNMQLDCGAQAIGCSFNHDDPTSPESALLGVGGAGQGLAWLRANAANPLPPFPEKLALAAAVNPITHIDAYDPPIFIAHGEADATVPIGQSVRLRDALLAIGGLPAAHTQYTPVPGAGHGALGNTTDDAAQAWLLARFGGPLPPLPPPPPCNPSCPADIDCSGTLDPDDLGDFINLFFAVTVTSAADFNRDAAVDPDDLGDYLNAYFGGCG